MCRAGWNSGIVPCGPDGGAKWSNPELTSLPNPNAKVNALVLSNGLLALAYNDHTAKEHKDGTRTNLTVAVSHDRGRTWRSIAQLENGVTQGRHIPMFQSPTMYQRGCFLFVAYSVRASQH